MQRWGRWPCTIQVGEDGFHKCKEVGGFDVPCLMPMKHPRDRDCRQAVECGSRA